MIEDITERRQAEEQAHRHAMRLEALNAVISASIRVSDLQSLLEITLDHVLLALGMEAGAVWTPDRYAIRGFVSEVEEGLIKEARAAIVHLSQPFPIEDWELEIAARGELSALGQTLLRVGIRASLTVPVQAEGRPLGGISVVASHPRPWTAEEIGLMEAIGQQLGMAVERLRLLEQMQEQAQRLQWILDTVPAGVVLLDAERRVILANPVARSHLMALAQAAEGDRLTHLGGRPIGELLAPPEEGLYREITTLRGVFEVAARPVGPGPHEGEWVLVIQDVTEERQIQQRLRLQERLATVGQLAAGIAHDFNNILQGVVGFTDLLLRQGDLPAPVRERLYLVAQQGRRGAHLVRQVLDFSRQSVAERHPLDLVPFLKETVRFLERMLPENIRLSLEIQPGSYLIYADLTSLQQVITNLATNARDAMPHGGELRLQLSRLALKVGDRPPFPEMPPGDWVVLRVADTGVGIPPEVLPHIFEPFFTTKAPGIGTGLGLSQVYGIIRQHDGFIDVESQVSDPATGRPGGTVFTAYLPALSIEAPVLPVQVQRPMALWKGRGETILVIEDDLQVLAVIQAMLEELGYEVLAARSGGEGLALYERRQQEIALVLLDMVLPETKGTDIFRALRRLNPEVKGILVTGYSVPEEVRALRAEGLSGFLQKPFSIETLADVVRGALARGTD